VKLSVVLIGVAAALASVPSVPSNEEGTIQTGSFIAWKPTRYVCQDGDVLVYVQEKP